MATGDDPNTILLTGQNRREQFEREEAEAAADVLTGALLEWNGDQVQPHGTAGADPGTTMIAVENRGRGMVRGDTYAAGANVHFIIASGNKVFLPVAAGNTVAKGDLLVSNGDGTVRPIDTDGTAPDDALTGVVAEGLEALDNAAGTEPAYVRADLVN